MKALKGFRQGSKGQTSVEYLVILAIAIVIAVVAVGVLSGFIKIGTATTYKKKGAVYWKSADIGIMDWEMRAAGTSTLILQNNKEYQISVDWIALNDGTTTTSFAVTQTLLPGDTVSSADFADSFVLNCNSGGSYSYEISFQYDNLEHSVNNKQFTGTEKMSGDCAG